MFDKFKNTAKHTIIYSIGNISTKLSGFVLLPLYSENLTLGEYGIYSILEATSQFMVGIFSFRFPTAMLRWCAQEKDPKTQKEISFTAFSSLAIILLLLNILLFSLNKTFSNLLFGDNLHTDYFNLLFANVTLGILSQIPLHILRFREKSVIYVTFSTLKLLLIVILNVYLIAYRNLGVKGILISQIAGHGSLILLSTPFMIINMRPRFRLKIFNEMMSYGFPLIFSAISAKLLTLGDKYVIKFFLEDKDVGLYSFGGKIAGVINVFIIQSFSTGFLPISYKIYEQKNSERFFSKIMTYMVFLLVFLTLILSIFCEELLIIFAKNKDYLIAYTIIPLLSFSMIFRGIQYLLSLNFHFVKKTKYNAYIIAAGASLNLILNMILIPIFGIYGAAFATITSFIFICIMYYIKSRQFYLVPYEFKKIFLLLFLGIVLYLFSIPLRFLPLPILIALKILIITSFPFLLYPFKFYEDVELEKINFLWIKWRNPKNWGKNLKALKK